MSRSARTRRMGSEPSPPRRQPAENANRRLLSWLVLLILGAGVAGGLWYGAVLLRPARQREAAMPAANVPPEPPPIDPAAALGLGDAVPTDAEGLRREAISVCDRLSAALPGRPEAHCVAALTLYRYGLKDEALAAWRRALELNPSFSPAQLGVGLVAADEGRDGEAIAALRQALQLNPSLEEAYAKLIEVLLRDNQSAEAAAFGETFTRRFPDSEKAAYWLGQAYLQLERYEEAIAAHEAALRKHPGLAPAHYSLAMAHARLGHREAAAECRKKFAELKAKDLEKDRQRNRTYEDRVEQQEIVAGVYFAAGDVHRSVGDPRMAEAHWLRGVQIRDGEIPCREGLAALYERSDRPRSASRVLDELARLKPGDGKIWLRLADVQSRLGEGETADASYRQAIAVEPDLGPAYLGLLRHALESGRRLSDAVALAKRAVELAPSPDSYLLLSTACDEAGDRQGAIASVEKALELAPNHPQLLQLHQQLQKGR